MLFLGPMGGFIAHSIAEGIVQSVKRHRYAKPGEEFFLADLDKHQMRKVFGETIEHIRQQASQAFHFKAA